MINRIVMLGVTSFLLVSAPASGGEAIDDSRAFQAAKIHGSAAAFRGYLTQCRVCIHRVEAAKRLDGIPENLIASERQPQPLDPAVTVNEVLRPAIVSSTPVRNFNTANTFQRATASAERLVSLASSNPTPLSLVPPPDWQRLAANPPRVLQVAMQSSASRQPASETRYFDTREPVVNRNTSRLLQGHSKTVWSVAYSPTGGVLASGGADKEIRLWPLAEGGASQQLSGHQSYISALDFSADGQLLASVGGDHSVRLWRNGLASRVLDHASREVSAVSFTRDSRRLVSGSEDSSLSLWDVGSGELQQNFNGHKAGVLAIAMSPYGDEFASSDASGAVLLWKLGQSTQGRSRSRQESRSKLKIFAHSGMAYDVEYASDGQQLFTAGADGLINRWHRSGAQAGVLAGHRSDVTSLAVHRSGDWLISGGRDQSVRVWNLRSGQQTAFFATKVGEIYSLALSPSGRRLAVSGTGDAVQLIELDLESSGRG